MKKPDEQHYREPAENIDLQKLQDRFTQGIAEVRKNVALALVPPAATALLFLVISVKKLTEGNNDYLFSALLSLPVLILAHYATSEARTYLQVLLQQKELITTDQQKKFDLPFKSKVDIIKHIEDSQDLMKFSLFLTLATLICAEGPSSTTLLSIITYILQAITLLKFEQLAQSRGALLEGFGTYIVTRKQVRVVIEEQPQPGALPAEDELQNELMASEMKR